MKALEVGFDGGVEFGGLRAGYEVSILICYLLKNSGGPLTREEIGEALLQEGLVNYFELANSLSELEKLEQIEARPGEDGASLFTVTEKGVGNLGMLEKELPKSVREKAVNAALRLLAKRKRLTENGAEIHRVKDGYQVTMKILDVGTDLMDLTLFAPDLSGAKRIRAAFLNDPQLLYKGVLALLTGDMQTVGELIPSEEDKLFE